LESDDCVEWLPSPRSQSKVSAPPSGSYDADASSATT
jgi:hypothetical protein